MKENTRNKWSRIKEDAGNMEGLRRRCAELEELLDAAIAGQETLQKALAESQRRERAAVEDLREGRCCRTCNVPGCSDVMISVTVHGCDKWQWRGPQEGELNAETDNPD